MYREIIDEAIERAANKESGLASDFQMDTWFGFSGLLGRHLFHNLVNFMNPRYLEVGVMKGNNFVPALYGNNFEEAFAVDLWPEPPHIHKDKFFERLNKYFPERDNIRVIHGDCFEIVPSEHGIENINLYFYDADHSASAQFKAWEYYLPYLADEFVIVVDDYQCDGGCWLCDPVREGTQQAIESLPVEIKHSRILTTPKHPDPAGWWHGFLIAHVKKWRKYDNV
jgi:hypothetical protein